MGTDVTTMTVTFWFFNCWTNSSWVRSRLNVAIPPMLYKAYIWKSVVKIRRGCIEFLLNNINKQVHLHQHCTTQLPKKYSRISLIQLFTRGWTQHWLQEGNPGSRIGWIVHNENSFCMGEVVYFVSYYSPHHITLHNWTTNYSFNYSYTFLRVSSLHCQCSCGQSVLVRLTELHLE